MNTEPATLSPRELDFMRGLRSSHTTRELAVEFGMSHSLLRVYLLALYRRMRVDGRTQAVAWFLAHATRAELEYTEPPAPLPTVEQFLPGYFLALCHGELRVFHYSCAVPG